MIGRDLVHGGAKAERADDRRTRADAEPLKARHIRVCRVVIDAAQQHRLELTHCHIVALVARRRGVGEVVRDHIRVLRLCNHAGGGDIESSPHSVSLFSRTKYTLLC